MTNTSKGKKNETLLQKEEKKVREELTNLFNENTRLAINEVTRKVAALIRNDDSEYDKAIHEVLKTIRGGDEQK